YAYKYSEISGGLIAVSELTSRKTKKRIMTIVLSFALYSGSTLASHMDITNFYSRDFFDFGQNKGEFQPGATDISILKKDGTILSLPEVPFPDFSPVSNKGATTAIGGAYSVTASHNGTKHHAVSTQNWGQSSYKFVDRMTSGDFAVTRLDKFVVETTGTTEGADISLSKAQALERYGINYKGKKQLIAFRAGAGSLTFQKDGRITQASSYSYSPDILNGSFVLIDDWSGGRVTTNNLFDEFKDRPTGGDSGSALFVYDNLAKKWVILGTLFGEYYYNNGQIRSAFNKWDNNLVSSLKQHFTQNIVLNGENGVINDNKIKRSNNQQEDNIGKDKDLYFTGGGKIYLSQNLDTGAGGLIFDKGHQYVLEGDGFSFKGAGVDIGKNTVVDWHIKGVPGDNIHKVGEGTLYIHEKQGNNLKAGNGTVVLGVSNAFNNIYLAGGPGKVVLNANNALSGSNEFGGIYFSEKGGVLDLNGYDQSFGKIAATDIGTVITNSAEKTSSLDINNKIPYIFHGNITNNVNINHLSDIKQESSLLIFDGNIDITKDINIKNTGLVMQGHATSHAIVQESKCTLPSFLCPVSLTTQIQGLEKDAAFKNGAEYKINNQVASFNQPDWETRSFRFKTLNLEKADFSTTRNAEVEGDIIASESTLTLGGNTPVFIDMNDGSNITGNGFGFRQDVRQGNSVGSSSYTGHITLNQNSTLNIGSRFTGGIDAYDSAVSITSPDVLLTAPGAFAGSSLTVHDGGHLTALNGLFSDGHIQAGKNGKITLSGTPVKDTANQYAPAVYLTDGYDLDGNNATLEITRGAHASGDIHASAASTVTIGSDTPAELASAETAASAFAGSLLEGYNAAFNGAITGGRADVSMHNALWTLGGDSTIHSLTVRNSRISSEGDRTFRTLTVNKLDATGSDFILRTDLKNADKINVTEKATGSDNSLNVSFMKDPAQGQSLNIPLVTAPAGTSAEMFKAGTRVTGFSRVTPTLHVDTSGGNTKWILDGFKTEADKAAAAKADSFMNAGYKNFMTEVNNLNKRMGDLRDTNGDAGAWARIMSGAGSADGGYSDNYTHVQVGFDKKHELDGVDLFTGVTMTYTDSSADSHAFSGKTKSVGGGLYASALFESGAYIDLIGKYIHHDNDYTGNFAGLGTKHYNTHSWYAGAETGYRYHLTEDTFIEPQAELVYGAVSGKTFRWKDGDMDLSMKNRDFSPLIGRTGIELGKTFSGKDWSVTARAGTSWQFDLLNNGETVLRDASGEKRIKGEKDSRMLFNVGMNAQIKDNMRFGLEFEKSAFGKYNVDNAVNANFRYMF
ncbi:autotransporter outer membrane beta-barrel domain-containing protein, partial [Salmonella enterica]|nr:autotransporter outer membrane beta-barrel domain-containing protein [Salmonella enterica]